MNEVATTISAVSKFKLAADVTKRTAIAQALGFKTIAEVNEAKKDKASPLLPAAKEYSKQVGDAAEIVEGETTYPNVVTVPVETLQEKIASDARMYHRIAILSARRKGEELPLRMSFNIFDLMEVEGDEDEGDYDKDMIVLALDGFAKARNLNDASLMLVQTALVGTKGTMLKLRKFFAHLQSAQDKFVSWLADNSLEGVDFDTISFWMKRQSKRLQSAIATPEIDESSISI